MDYWNPITILAFHTRLNGGDLKLSDDNTYSHFGFCLAKNIIVPKNIINTNQSSNMYDILFQCCGIENISALTAKQCFAYLVNLQNG